MGVKSDRDAVVKAGDVIESRYRIIRTLGEGGMGTVFLAEHVLIKRKVALKVLHADLTGDEKLVDRFMNEARAAGTLGHPNIVESTDMGFTRDDVPYIVFEYLEGTLLTDEIYRVGGLPLRRAVRIAGQIASAMQAAHDAGIVHRDLKSDNIFLADKNDVIDHVKVLDFGGSRLLDADERSNDVAVGTPEFMAPEQLTQPAHVDKRADIYALGVILYEMLTARRPFSNDEGPRQLKHRIVHELPPPLMRPEVPNALSALIFDRMLAKDRNDRFHTMADVEAALAPLPSGGAIDARPPSQPLPLAKAAVGDDPVAMPVAMIETPVAMIETPVATPVATIDTPVAIIDTPVAIIDTPVAMGQVELAQASAPKRPYALYGVAGAGIVMGTIGLIVGLRGSDAERTPQIVHAPPPTPVVLPAAKPEPAAAKIDARFDADVANARIVFRRRVTQAPTALVINAADVVELVEVSAPGYRTTRYWLTFDRPTHLRAHLARGSGSVEATEEQTLAALGDVILVPATEPAPAAAATAVTGAPAAPPRAEKAASPPVTADARAVRAADAVPTSHSAQPSPAAQVAPATLVAMAPRKIGRSVADEANPDANHAKPPEPAASEDLTPAANTSFAPGSEPVVKEEPRPAAIARTEPTSEPPKVATPAAVGVDAVQPSLDRVIVSSVVNQHRPEVLKCFAEGKKHNGAIKGTLSVQLEVDAAGKVHRVQVQSTLSSPLVAACVIKVANGWKFPTLSVPVSASYPFTVN